MRANVEEARWLVSEQQAGLTPAEAPAPPRPTLREVPTTSDGIPIPEDGISQAHFAKGKWLNHFKNSVEYLHGAQNIIHDGYSGAKYMETYLRSNGDRLFYNIFTNEFLSLSSKNIIRTYFKPIDGYSYWLNITNGR